MSSSMCRREMYMGPLDQQVKEILVQNCGPLGNRNGQTSCSRSVVAGLLWLEAGYLVRRPVMELISVDRRDDVLEICDQHQQQTLNTTLNKQSNGRRQISAWIVLDQLLATLATAYGLNHWSHLLQTVIGGI